MQVRTVAFIGLLLVGPAFSLTSGYNATKKHAAAFDESPWAPSLGLSPPPALTQSVRRLMRRLGSPLPAVLRDAVAKFLGVRLR
eukprot:CAMPEP_0179362032 /NCGR_PEP_ID=MMETSP0797-20121207/80807_1 /TAXON_ID=47934 /ORGANISM="Dinophysis acuminata, Strain DAEP01" /LENGTH=83 /DNA_ID=CAMNT_0021077453 /DNA_START=8 /DNA_END=255 /DNA_ORIENTATION=+